MTSDRTAAVRRVCAPRRARAAARQGVAVVALLAGVLAGLGAQVPGAPPVGAATCGPAPQGQVAVVMVVDRGSGTPSSRCVTLPQGATGLDALRAAGHQVRLDGGFVCGIDGLPATGCGNRPDAGFAYWRYWHAAPGGAWTYSQVGAGGYRLPSRCAVEGWVWSDSPSSDTPPRVAAPSPTCEAPAPTAAPTTAPSRPTPTTPAPAGPSAGSADPGAGAGAGGGGGSAGAPAPQVGGVTTTPDGGGPGAPDGSAGSAAGDDLVDGGTGGGGTGDAGGGAADGDGTGGDDTSGDGGSGRGGAGGGAADELAVDASTTPSGSAPAPWGAVVALVLIAALGTGAIVGARRRRNLTGDA